MFLEPGMFPPHSFRFSAALLRPHKVLKNQQTSWYMSVSTCRKKILRNRRWLTTDSCLENWSSIPLQTVEHPNYYGEQLAQDHKRRSKKVPERVSQFVFKSARNGGCRFCYKRN